MRELLFGGILYLTGVAIVLVIRPRLLFKDNGDWKEFGIGRNPSTHTWMPFWLFCIFWALISYSITYVLLKLINGNSNTIPNSNLFEQEFQSVNSNNSLPKQSKTRGLRRASRVPPVGNQGYYVLNQEATARNGIPHYRYIGGGNGSNMSLPPLNAYGGGLVYY